MKKVFLMLTAASALVSSVFAAADGGFGIDAFNRSISAGTRGNAVFSPFSFDIDGVTFSEAFGALDRAQYAEAMRVLNGLEAVYKPKYEYLVQSTNGISFVSARAFCLPDERKALPAYRQWLQNAFSAEAFTFAFRKGAACWFRARLDGIMEDFELPQNAVSNGYYSYYDLVSVKVAWHRPFPKDNTRDIEFKMDNGKKKMLPAIADRRQVDCLTRRRCSIIRLPMADKSWFYALIPNEGTTVRDLRGELNSSSLLDIFTGFKSVTEMTLTHSVSTVVIPKMEIDTDCDLKQSFGYFRLPLTEMERLDSTLQPKFIRQRVHFRLDEEGVASAETEEEESSRYRRSWASAAAKDFVLNRPFIFFVFHGPTGTIPVSGVFMGQ